MTLFGSIFTSNKPRITSNGGGGQAHIDVNENTRFVTDVQTYDKYSTEANGRLKYSIIGGASAKFFEIDSRTGKLFFKEAPDFENPRDVVGQDNLYEVKIQVKDAAGYTDSQRLLVKVKDVQENGAPNAQNDSASVIESQSLIIDVLNNDSDPDGDPLSITSLNGQAIAPGQTVSTDNGSVTLLVNGELSFAPNAGFTGTETFSYHVEDPQGAEDTATVSVVVNPEPNQAPNANNDSSSTTAGTPVTINALGNDSDPNGDPLSITSLNGQSIAPGQTISTANGSVTLQANGQLSFAPNAGFVGTESFTYHAEDPSGAEDTATVSVVVSPAPNQAPNAANDSASTTVGTPVTIDALNNDSDPNGDPLSITSLNGQSIAPGQTIATANGSVTLLGNGELSFAPNAGFTGTETFSYHAEDPSGAEDTATVSVVVSPAPNQAPDANNDSASTTVGTPVTIDALGNDSDPNGDPLSITSLNGQNIAPGQTISTANGAVTLLGNGELSFAPNAGFTGTETFSYHAEDPSGAEDTATVSVVVSPAPNQAPNAANDSASTTVGTPVTIDALNNDSDPNGDPLSITSLNGQSIAPGQTIATANGSVTLLGNGELSFAPNAGFTGTETFSYHAEDPSGAEDTATVSVVVSPAPNQAPDANNDSASTTVGTPVTIDALNNDSDPNGDPLSITSLNGQSIAPGQTVSTANGSVTLQANGQLSFAPNAGFVGNEVFSYHVNDGKGGEDTAQVQVTVAPPVDPKTGKIGNRVFLDANQNGVLDNGEGGVNGIKVTLVGSGEDGTFGTSDDLVRSQITSNGGYYGFGNLAADRYQVGFSQLPDGIEFTTANVGLNENVDSDANPTTGVTEVINLAPAQILNNVDAGVVERNLNQAPNANDDSANTTIGTPVTINALGNDSDPNGDPLSITSLNGQSIAPGQTVSTANGSVTLQSNGQLSFAPNAGFVGNEVFSYHVNDGKGGEDTAQVQVTVAAPVDPKTGKIGNRVFLDANQNGVLDNGEGGFGGVRVTLTGAGQDGVLDTGDDVTVGSQVVGSNGFYGFDNLAGGNYKVTFSDLPSNVAFTSANVGSDEHLDSDANPLTGMTDTIVLAPGERLNNIDAGVVNQAPGDPGTGKIGNRVFFDANQNGVLDNGEGGFGGVRVTLTGAGQDGVIDSSDDVTVGSQVVGSNGFYGFNNLTAGNYKVTFSQIASGFGLTAANVGSNEASDSDANSISGMTGVIALAAGEINDNVDAGIVKQQGGKNKIFGTEQSNWPIKGTNGDDSIFGLGGNDKLEGLGGNDHLTGGTGYDHLLGGQGNDTLNGTNDVALGQFEIDTLTGGAGRDRFILANNDTSYYFGDKWGGFAVIRDFTVGEDVAVLHGPAEQYALELDSVRGATYLYCLGDGGDKSRDVIAAFEGNTNLNLASADFQFIG